MGEIKSVKVDNWGVFFLQKLQNFFNKTDYCDLTLQFRDNSQLKVHRLVLSACTDFFNVLEQKCEVVDDAIIMPNGLQADVVVPIVNFMYTGTLEFELKMYNRLLKTAKDMNMTVLLKLLEAHRRTMEMHPQKIQAPTSPKMRRKPVASNTVGVAANIGGRSLIQTQQQRRIVVGENIPQQHQRNVQSNTRVTSSSMPSTSLIPIKQQIGSTTFTRIKQEPEQDENVSAGGYTVLKKVAQHQQHTATSPFEQLRKGYNNNKRPAATTFISPPAKKPNLEDVKEFAEQQRMRKQIAAEFGDDGDYDTGIMDDDTIHNDDDDDDMASTSASATPASASAAVQTTQQQSEDPPGTTTIIVKHEGPDKPPTVVVKDSSNSKLNHAKIISEVLKQYPHLVNSNKNIKLKIMPNAGGQTQKIIVKKEPAETEKIATSKSGTATDGPKLPKLQRLEDNKIQTIPSSIAANQLKPQSLQSGSISTNKIVPASTTTQAAATTSAPASGTIQKRRIDSKTMHSLIALGAENTTGPWLCLRCGRNGHPISIPSYRGFRRHLINTHKETIDSALCEHCGWRSANKRTLHFHMQMEHKIRTNLYIFPECELCQQMCIDSDALNQHLIDNHPDENKQQCIYCNKIFAEELQLYTHMKTFHKKQALEDGIIDYSDDDNVNNDLVFPPPLDDHDMEVDHAPQQQEQKIKILSDISLPIASSIIKTDTFASSTEQILTAGESTTSAASEEYLHDQQEQVETKLVAPDGSEVILTAEQRKELLSQLNQENYVSSVLMVLNENQNYTGGEAQSELGLISHDETSQATTATNEEHDDSLIYNELKSQGQQETEEEDVLSQTEPEAAVANEQDEEEDTEHADEQGKGETLRHDAALEESKESTDNLEWAENLISEHMADEISETTPEASAGPQKASKDEEPKDDDGNKSQEDISKKLKELAGEWSEDDEDEEDMLDEPTAQNLDESEEISKGDKADNNEKENEAEGHEMLEAEKVLEEMENKGETTEADEKVATDEITSELIDETKKEEKESNTSCEKKSEAADKDDVDLALMSLHKENNDVEDINRESTKEKKEEETIQADAFLAPPTEIKEDLGVVQDTTTTTEANVEDKDVEKNEETPQEEVKNSTEECEATLTEDEETKKDLIDMLLSEHAAAVVEQKEDLAAVSTIETAVENLKAESVEVIKSDVASDTPDAVKTQDDNQEKIEKSFTTDSPTQKPLHEDEFLDITPEKTETNKEDMSTDATVSSPGPEAPAKDNVNSAESVKNLISDWGDDDDEEENDNDADLKENL